MEEDLGPVTARGLCVDEWEQLFERVVVPVVGLLGIVYAAVGGPVPEGLYPVLLGLVGYPIARHIDKRRKANGGK